MHAAEDSERRAERLRLATRSFGGALSLQEMADVIVDQAAAALSADSAMLAAVEPSGTSLRFIAVRNIAVVIAEIAPVVEAQAAGKELQLKLAAAPASLAAKADRHRLRQILVDLVGNAIEFTPRHGKVLLDATRDGDAVMILISDTGPGVPPRPEVLGMGGVRTD